MNALLFVAMLTGSLGGWHSYTNTNFVNGIAGDDSTLYLATNGGVVELGAGPPPFTVRTYVNSDSLPVNQCLCIAQDSAGNSWVGTNGGGLAVIEKGALRAQPYRPNDFSPRVVRALAWDGHLLLAGTDQGLYLLDTRGTLLDFDDDRIQSYTVAAVRELLSDRVLSVAVLDRYWIGTNLGVTSVERGFTGWVGYRQPLGDSVRAIAEWRDSLLAATEDGIAVLGDSGFRPVLRFATPTEVYDLAVAGSSIYLATKVGLFQGDSIDSTRFQVVLREDCRAVQVGRVLWVGCGGTAQSGSGLRYLASGQSWEGYWNSCIISNQVSDCVTRMSGDIYLCHFGWPISWIKPDGSIQILYDVLPVPVQARVDSRGRIWLAHFSGGGGLSVYDPADQSWQTVQWGASSSWNIIDALGLDRNDTKWVFNGGAVIIAVDSAGGQAVFEVAGLPPPPGGLYEFAFDSRGRAWLGLTVGLVMLDYNGTLLDQSDDRDTVISAGLPSPEVRSVAVDAEDDVWVATPGGAAYWNGAEFRAFTMGNSKILSNNVYRVRVDGSDRVWLLCDAGLSIYDQISNTWTNYTPQNSGLIANTDATVGFYTSLDVNDAIGTALVGTLQGLSSLDFSAPTGSSAENLHVYPNPCVMGVHNGVVVDSLPDDASGVDVRTLDGRLVAELRIEAARHRAVWRPTGRASGIYLLVVNTPRGVHIERVALVSR